MEKKKRSKGQGSTVTRKALLGTLGLSALVILLWKFPLFRVVPLERKAFDVRSHAREFWNEKLMKSLDQAVPAPVLLAAISEDTAKARDRYGRTFGIGSDYYYYVAGIGRVVEIEPDSVEISLGDSDGGNVNVDSQINNKIDNQVDIQIATAHIFGNAIRNGTGLLDINNFPNSQDFNKISIEINRIVQDEVLPPFRKTVAVGSRVSFAGCARIKDEKRDLQPLRIIPIVASVE